MRSLPMCFRLAEELSRMPRIWSAMQLFHEPSVWCVPIPRSWKLISRWQEQEFTPLYKITKEDYQIMVNVKDYDELKVKVVDDSVVLIEGKSEQKVEGQCSYKSSYFLRRFVLPEGYMMDKVSSSLSSDGVLTINVPGSPVSEDQIKERLVPIQNAEAPAKTTENEIKDEKKVK